MFTYKRLTKGLLGSNTYILWENHSRECAIIDAGNPTAAVWEIVDREQLIVQYIILTHAHYDHIYFFDEYRKRVPGAKAVAHPLDDAMLPNPRLNASSLFGPEHKFSQVDLCVEEGTQLPLGETFLRIYHTPGHTPGGICILADKYLFTGDTLFYDGFGRTDLGAGSVQAMSASIERLYTMNPEWIVLPGHGIATTIGREARENPYMDF